MMKLIGENLHIISASTREAILAGDEKFVRNLISRQVDAGMDFIDLNIGPAKKNFEGIMQWLVAIHKDISNIPISFDSSNISEIESGLNLIKNPSDCIINSTSADTEKLEAFTDLAKQYDSNFICLTLSKESGIPKVADERLALAFEMVEFANNKGIENNKLYFDPLILPLSVEQTQACEALNAIRMFKESFDPVVNTTIGLSNISNGSPKELRGLINRVFFVLASGCGLDSAIVDAFDTELLRINKVIKNGHAEKKSDELVLNLVESMRNFDDLNSVQYDSSDEEQVKIYKTAEILLNKKVYSHSYLDI